MNEEQRIAPSLFHRFQQVWKAYTLTCILGLQAVLLLVAFPQILLHPEDYMLCNYNDGIRQYFFYQSYVEQAPDQGWTKVQSMGYPYGEYVFFTDATPMLALAIKFISTYLADLSPFGIYIFNLFILLGHFLSSFFLYKILSRLDVQAYLIVLFSLCLPWLGIEFFKITQGHLNLSISWPLLGTIYFLQKIPTLLQEDRKIGRLHRHSLKMGAFLFVIGLIHLYWIAMAGLLVLVFMFCLLIKQRHYRTDAFRTVNSTALGLVIPVLVLGLLIRVSDGFFEDRLSHGEGYGWEHWVLQFEGLFSSHAHNSIPFVFEDSNLYSFGSFAFLGNFALYAFLILALEFLVHKAIRIHWKKYIGKSTPGRFFLFIGIATLTSLLISLGETIYIERLNLYLTNYLNPFYYLHLLTDRVTQFRDVSRFSFIVFWFFNILMVYLLNIRLKYEKLSGLNYALGAILMLLCVVDTTDSLRLARKEMNRPNLLNIQASPEIYRLGQKIDPQKYQAIIPIPFNHEGAGDNHYVIDGFDDFLTQTLQFQRATQIPLMSAKFARGNYEHAKAILSMFQGKEEVASELIQNLSEKPVLILYNADFYNGNRELTGNKLEPAWSILQNCHKIIEEYGMQELTREGSFILYEGKLRN